uniref:Uncharacterized protein n=1 Tax=Arundo donax TaxID=35708 RepID=A0A0A9BUW1_ARUDO
MYALHTYVHNSFTCAYDFIRLYAFIRILDYIVLS